jgi:hypothetical protein
MIINLKQSFKSIERIKSGGKNRRLPSHRAVHERPRLQKTHLFF